MPNEPVTDDLRAVGTEQARWLQSCPFCGFDVPTIKRADDDGPLYYVSCSSCGGASGLGANVLDAGERWNRRALLARPVDEPHEHGYECYFNLYGDKMDEPQCSRTPIVPSASSPTNVRVELPHRAMSCGHCRCNLVDVQTGDLCGACERLERIAEIIERNGYVCRDGSPSTFGRQYQSVLQIYKLATEELGRSHKGEV